MFLYANVFKARLATNIADDDLTIEIDDASKLPALAVGQYLVLEVVEDAKIERMRCTNVSGTTLTVERAEFYPYAFRKNSLCVIGIDPYGYELASGSGLTQAQILARTSIGF